MADFGALSKLTKKADAVATSASVLVQRAIRDINGEIANLSRELNLAGSSADRDKVYGMIGEKMNRLSRQLNRLLVAQNELAAKTAAKSASAMTGVEIKYSAKRAQAVFEMVSPAQGENLAAVFTDKMGAGIVNALRNATVDALREQAVAGGSLKETAAAMRDKWFDAVKDGVPHFTDASGREWNTAAYFQMNVRTNSMRVYNDCLIDDVARETGSDIMRISTGGSDPNCECAAWEGTLISLTGKTPGLPTYDDAKAGGCFHPNCVHTLEVVDEYADADEIKRAQAHPFDRPDEDGDIWEAQDNRKYEIDQAVKMDEQGLTKEQARVAVDRDNLAASIRAGLIREDADAVVAKMTDEQVTRLCPNGNPPEFEPAKGTKKHPEHEVWNHGKWGGVVHIKRDADAEDILKVCKVDEPPKAPPTKATAPVGAPDPADNKTPAPAKNAPQALPVPDFKTAEEAETYMSDKYGVTAVGFKTFTPEQQKGIVEATRDAFENGCQKVYLRFVSTGQAMFKDEGAKRVFLEERAKASASDLFDLAPYRWKGVRHKLQGTDAEWYGICQELKATGKTVAHCISFGANPILSKFNGIYFNPKTVNSTDGARQVEIGWWVPGGETLKGTMAHELGHAIDKSLSERGLRLCEQTDLRNLFNTTPKADMQSGLSRYGATKATEMVAEAWCEYTTQKNPRPIAKKIGDLIKSKVAKAAKAAKN